MPFWSFNTTYPIFQTSPSLGLAFSSIAPAFTADVTLYPGAANLVENPVQGKNPYYYAAQLANEMVPAAVHQTLNTYPSLRREFYERHPEPIKLAVKAFVGQRAFPDAFVTNLHSGELLFAYNTWKYTQAGQMPPPLGTPPELDVRGMATAQSTVVHKCTHLVVGQALGAPTNSWFNEGIAEATASGMAWNRKASPDTVMEMLTRDKLNAGSSLANYGQGYFAVTYIGWMAGDRKSLSEVSDTEFEQSI